MNGESGIVGVRITPRIGEIGSARSDPAPALGPLRGAIQDGRTPYTHEGFLTFPRQDVLLAVAVMVLFGVLCRGTVPGRRRAGLHAERRLHVATGAFARAQGASAVAEAGGLLRGTRNDDSQGHSNDDKSSSW